VGQAFSSVKTSSSTIDAVTDTIEGKLLDIKSPILGTGQVTAIILTTLKNYDTPAFLRYLASHASLRSKSELKNALKSF
jgi:transcriptional regulator NrdR family protein